AYLRTGRTVTFDGDNNPGYAGSVVRAMASAKDGAPHVEALFARDIAGLNPAGQAARDDAWRAFTGKLDDEWRPTVGWGERLTPTIVEGGVGAPAAARHLEPGQFFRLQNFEALSRAINGSRLMMEGLALTGAWVDQEKGLLSLIVLEMGGSSRLCAGLEKGEAVVVMGPTGTPTEIPEGGEAVALAGGGLGNAVLFSIGKALRARGNRVIYFAAYRKREDVYKIDEIEAAADQIVWSVDGGDLPEARRAQDPAFPGNGVQAIRAYPHG